jgi:hypothetical protein
MGLTLARGYVGGTAHRRAPYFKTKKLGLLGNTSSLELAPWTDTSWTLAAHPCCRPRCPREPDWYFDLHRPELFRQEIRTWNKTYYTWLKTLQTPVFMQENYPEIPMSVKYPLARILAEYRRYFTNQCAFMIALAMTEGVTHIGLFGCQYSHETEHGVQRDSLTYWLGRFEQAGGTVVIPAKHNTLLCAPNLLYGYESHDKDGKLVPQYTVAPMVTVKKKDGSQERRALTMLDQTKAEGRIPLMKLPNGETPAWGRSGHSVYA